MGLDSVELLYEIQQYFSSEIANKEAEKITTVQDMVDAVSSHLKITSDSKTLQTLVFTRISVVLKNILRLEKDILLTDRIAEYLQVGNNIWFELEKELGLKVSQPTTSTIIKNKFLAKLFKLAPLKPGYEWNSITLYQFTDAVCAENYKTLLNPPFIKSTYEIYIAIVGITADKIGVDYYEVLPEKSFTSDLGVD